MIRIIMIIKIIIFVIIIILLPTWTSKQIELGGLYFIWSIDYSRLLYTLSTR